MAAPKRKLDATHDEPTGPGCDIHEHARRRFGEPPSDDAFRRAAALLRAAGDARRLQLLMRLAEGELCVTELADGSTVSLPAISQHLSILKTAQIVTRRRAGRHIYYSLQDTHVLALVQNALAHAAEESVE